MRVAVTGKSGQVVTALVEAGTSLADVTILPVGRPEVDLADVAGTVRGLRASRPDVIVNAAAYTAVDQAEKEPEIALAINAMGAAAAASAAVDLGIPIIQISTDYVFNGAKDGPYEETDPVGPIGAYGWSKLAGEVAVASIARNHAILRTSWVYASEGKNFFRTMLRLAASRPEIGVVSDQRGTPTYAPDIAVAVIQVARNLLGAPERAELRGVFHMSGSGETSWAGFAEAIFAQAARRGGPSARVRPIATADYPTPARRPANSRLDTSRLATVHGVTMPHWEDALERCVSRVPFAPGDYP